MRKTSYFVAAVVATALVASAGVYYAWPTTDLGTGSALATLSALAVLSELLGYMTPRVMVTGSIAFIPYLACVFLTPAWPAVLAVTAVRWASELLARRPAKKALFNVGQHAISICVAIVVYRATGGLGLLVGGRVALSDAALAFGIPSILAVAIALAVNSVLVSVAIGLSRGEPFVRIWREAYLATFGLDIAAGPLIFVFAWVYVAFGPLATAALWTPILGLRQVYTTNVELERTNQELLQLMVKSIEARDPYTSGHSRRVEQYSRTIARALGLGDRAVERVARAALLHDVGKIYEKYAPILRKRDKLSPEEWVTMKEHPSDGAVLVATMSGLKDLVPAVRHHHENWDGTGYPDGLAGEAIPLESRIIAFADTIDAMTTERPYRASLTEAQVRSEFIRQRGRQFDPELTDRLLASSLWNQIFLPARDEAQEASPKFSLMIAQGSGRSRSRTPSTSG